MRSDVPIQIVEQHIRRFFAGHDITKHTWLLGPVPDAMPEFQVLCAGPGPRTGCWTYLSLGASTISHDETGLLEFFVVAPDNILKMEIAAASGNLDTLRIASHSLKSNGRDFGAVDLANLCQRLEQACKSGAVSDAVGQVAAIAAAFAAAKSSLKKLVAGNE